MVSSGAVVPGRAAKCPCERGGELIIKSLNLQESQNTALVMLGSQSSSLPFPLLKSSAADGGGPHFVLLNIYCELGV